MTTLNPEDVDGVPVICESCGTALKKTTEREAEQTAFDHNDVRHNGKSVAKAVTSPVDVGHNDLKPEESQRFVRQIVDMLDG